MRLNGKICVITGAASGIGKVIAAAFAKEGGKVIIADLNPKAAQTAADEINAGGGHAIPIELDVTAETQVDKAMANIAARFGTVDVLVSNAGIQIVHPIEDFPLPDWKKIMSVHLDGAFLTTRACFRLMKEAGAGSIICVEMRLRCGKAWPDWPVQDGREGGRQIRHPRQRDLSWLRAHAVG
jgi:3-hydroxybutyrate dehydrogenase